MIYFFVALVLSLDCTLIPSCTSCVDALSASCVWCGIGGCQDSVGMQTNCIATTNCCSGLSCGECVLSSGCNYCDGQCKPSSLPCDMPRFVSQFECNCDTIVDCGQCLIEPNRACRFWFVRCLLFFQTFVS